MLPALVCAVVLAVAPVPPTPEGTVNAFVDAINAGEAPAAAALFAADGEWLPPDGAVITGRDAIARHLVAALRSLRSLDTLTVRVERDGALAVVRGRLTVSHRTRQHGVDVSLGNYVFVLRRQGAGWQIVSGLFTQPIRPDVVG